MLLLKAWCGVKWVLGASWSKEKVFIHCDSHSVIQQQAEFHPAQYLLASSSHRSSQRSHRCFLFIWGFYVRILLEACVLIFYFCIARKFCITAGFGANTNKAFKNVKHATQKNQNLQFTSGLLNFQKIRMTLILLRMYKLLG